MLKTWPLPRTAVVGCGGSRRYNHSNIYHDPAIGYSITCVDRVLAGGAVVTNAFHSKTRVGICVR